MTAIVIKSTTKKGQNMLQNASKNEGFFLDDVYGKHSPAKHHAWLDCFYKCSGENGKNFHIYSHNTFGFSVAWEVENGTRIVTPKNNYLVVEC